MPPRENAELSVGTMARGWTEVDVDPIASRRETPAGEWSVSVYAL